MIGRSLPQCLLAKEGQVAIAGTVLDGLMGSVQGGSRRSNIRVHVLQPQDRGIAGGIGCRAHAIDADTCHVLKPGDSHGTLSRNSEIEIHFKAAEYVACYFGRHSAREKAP